jgi:hypothetical protein
MATLGQQLKAAREAKGVSESDAGSATKTLTKVIIAMEADDFSIMPAPTYAKGFIRLYAEYLELDPVPLVEEYTQTYTTAPRPLINPSSQFDKNSRPSSPFSIKLKAPSVRVPWLALFGNVGTFFSRGWKNLPGIGWKDIRVLAGIVAGVIILIILISSLSHCAQEKAPEGPTAKTPGVAPARMLLDEPVQDLYLVAPGRIETN